jgi:polyribonucleotide nucleotidyltransferase
MQYSVERDIGGKTLRIETGKLANQAGAAVLVSCGETILLATACAGKPRDIDFLPLTVDYEERLYAAGRVPGSFFRREGRPGQEAILFGRLTDRPLRPLFPKGIRNDLQLILTVLCVDKENPPEILGIIGASAALSISDIPFDGPVGASRVTHKDGAYLVNPTYEQIDEGDLSVVVAGTRDAVMMVEAESEEVPEDIVLQAIRRSQEINGQIIEMIDEMVGAVGKPKFEFSPPAPNTEI